MIEDDIKAGQNPGDLRNFLKRVDQGAYDFNDACFQNPTNAAEESKVQDTEPVKKPAAPLIFEVVGSTNKNLDG